jgi:glycosyltransferase involved in cell wall biosynthesis
MLHPREHAGMLTCCSMTRRIDGDTAPPIPTPRSATPYPRIARTKTEAGPRPARRIRVCQFTPSFSGGGAEERIARVLASMDRDHFDLAWIAFGDVQHGLIERAGLGIEWMPIERDPARGVEPHLIFRTAMTLSRFRPDVLHVHNWSTSLYGIAAARLVGIPLVIYGDGGRDVPEGPSRRRRALMRALAPHVDRFTAVCDFLGKELQEHWRVPADRVHVIPNGVDLPRIDAALEKKEARRRLGLPQDGLVVGAIAGRFRDVKRLPNLIDAIGRIAADRPHLHLALVGDPLEHEHDLRSRATALGLDERFHLPGHVAGVHAVLKAFDVIVNCSVFEGASNAVLEAMGSGLPVVATSVGGTPEMIVDGESGLLVPPDDVGALARAIAQLADDPAIRARCGKNARRRIEERHTHEAMLAQYVALYREAGDQPARKPWRRLGDLGASVVRLASEEAAI